MQLLDRRFNNLMKSLAVDRKSSIAVACSGGADSMALALLAKEWADEKHGRLVALTVDHAWHKDSAKEVQQVGRWLKKRGITQVVLPWKGRKPNRNQHDSVRKARYSVLTDYCKQHKITHLFAAHHIEDQAEMFLLRLAHSGSVDGLSAMPALTIMYDITLVRPLLGVTKAELIDHLKKHKQPFVNDPDNEDKTLDRVKVRKLLPLLSDAGISVQRLARTAVIMARARAHLEEETGSFLKVYCKILPEGYALFKHIPASEEIALRVLTALIMIVGGQDIKTRNSDLECLYTALMDSKFKAMTLSGCVFQRQKEGIIVYRELRCVAAPKSLKVGVETLWDNRFLVTVNGGANQRLKIGTLGKAGWLMLAKVHKMKSNCPNKNILYSLAALRDAKGAIVAVPSLKYIPDEAMQCSITFRTYSG